MYIGDPMTDEDFQYFLEEFGPQIGRREVPPSSIDYYQGRLPDRLLEYWQEYGWSGYSDGLFWIVNPREYDGALSEWLSGSIFEGKDNFHVIATGAFGKIYVWGEEYGNSFSIVATESYIAPRHNFSARPKDKDFDIRCFFSSKKPRYLDSYEMFDQAVARLGRLDVGQMYGFFPAVAIGGTRTVENIQKVSAVEHLTFLAQLEGLSILKIPD